MIDPPITQYKANGCNIIRLSPHGDVRVAMCFTPDWARAIATLLNENDQK